MTAPSVARRCPNSGKRIITTRARTVCQACGREVLVDRRTSRIEDHSEEGAR